MDKVHKRKKIPKPRAVVGLTVELFMSQENNQCSIFLPRWIKQSEKLEAESAQPELVPKLDLGFKEGQTITINLGPGVRNVPLLYQL